MTKVKMSASVRRSDELCKPLGPY